MTMKPFFPQRLSDNKRKARNIQIEQRKITTKSSIDKSHQRPMLTRFSAYVLSQYLRRHVNKYLMGACCGRLGVGEGGRGGETRAWGEKWRNKCQPLNIIPATAIHHKGCQCERKSKYPNALRDSIDHNIYHLRIYHHEDPCGQPVGDKHHHGIADGGKKKSANF